MSIREAHFATVLNNVVSGCTGVENEEGTGIDMNTVMNADISHNTITDNYGIGILSQYGANNTFYTNTLSEIQSVKDRNRLLFIITGALFVIIIGIFLYYRSSTKCNNM